MTAPLSLSAIREQLAGITRGEWRHERAVMSDVVETSNRVHIASTPSQHDAAFIAAAPSTVARLLGALERVEALVERSESHGNLYVFVDDISAAITGEGRA